MKQLLIFFTLLTLFSCNSTETKKVGIQPFNKAPQYLIDSIESAIKQTYHFEVYQLNEQEIPQHAFTQVKSPRYRADTLIRFLKHNKPDTIDYILGITNKDISTTKKDKNGNIKKPHYKYKDWGVFGLGYVPGPSSIVSTYRYKKSAKQLFIERVQKISIHELGHNLGLPHCKSGNPCVMQDAAETIKTIDNVDLVLCTHCKQTLKIQ